MRTKKKNNRRKKPRKSRGHALAGSPGAASRPLNSSLLDALLVFVTAISAGGAGAVIGKHSLLAGIPLTFYGIHKGNKYIMAAGLGLSLSNGFQKPKSGSASVQGIDGFSFKQFTDDAKDRVGTYFKNFSEKLYLPAANEQQPGEQQPFIQQSEPQSEQQTTEGFGDDQVTYFVNPYRGKGEPDMSALDRIQEQIAQMNGHGNLSDIEREF